MRQHSHYLIVADSWLAQVCREKRKSLTENVNLTTSSAADAHAMIVAKSHTVSRGHGHVEHQAKESGSYYSITKLYNKHYKNGQ